MNPKVSIIIPVYNVEKYIERCVRTLFAQTLDDIEYIFIDDCSPDGSIDVMLGVLEEYPQRKPQVKLIRHETNQGVGKSRQDGVDTAIGEYIIHCDPDDWVDLDMYEILYTKAKETDADLVLCDFIIESSKRHKFVSQKPTSMDPQVVQCELFLNIYGALWNKLIKRTCIIDNNIVFNNKLSLCEDLCYITGLLNNQIKIEHVSEYLYHYSVIAYSSSIIHKYNNQSFEYDVKLLDIISKIVKDRPASKYCMAHLSNSIVSRAFWANIYTSAEFKNKCKRYRRQMSKYPQNFFLKTAYNIACIGGYKIIYSIIVKLKKL